MRQRKSTSRTRRHTNREASAPTLVTGPNNGCGQLRSPHIVRRHCGRRADRQALRPSGGAA